MGQLRPGSARTTQAIRRASQHSQQSRQSLAQRHGSHPKTGAKGRKRPTAQDAAMGPKPASTVLSPQEEAAAVAFRQHPQRPLDDGLSALQASMPRLTRSALPRLFQCPGVSRLPDPEPAEKKKKVKASPLGYLPVDWAEVRTEPGKLYLLVALDRPSKVAFAERQPRATKRLAADLLRRVLAARPSKGHKVRTDNGTPFGNLPHRPYAGRHLVDRVGDEHGIEHRFTTPPHPRPHGQVERLNRPLKEAPGRRYHYQPTEQLHEPWHAFLLAYHHAKRLKTLRGLTPHEFVCVQHQQNPAIFTLDPTHLTLGLYS